MYELRLYLCIVHRFRVGQKDFELGPRTTPHLCQRGLHIVEKTVTGLSVSDLPQGPPTVSLNRFFRP